MGRTFKWISLLSHSYVTKDAYSQRFFSLLKILFSLFSEGLMRILASTKCEETLSNFWGFGFFNFCGKLPYQGINSDCFTCIVSNFGMMRLFCRVFIVSLPVIFLNGRAVDDDNSVISPTAVAGIVMAATGLVIVRMNSSFLR